jgi:hypothetical protein
MTTKIEELLSDLIDQAKSLKTGDLAGADALMLRVHMLLRNLYADTKKPWDAHASNIHFEPSGFLGYTAGQPSRIFDNARTRLVNLLEAALEEERLFSTTSPDSVQETREPLRIPSQRSTGESSRRRPRVFVLMPFDPAFDWLYEEVRAAGEDAGVAIERADDIFQAGIVIDQIKTRIKEADIVIAVCTGRNPNVFYELGIAESIHRPILIGEQSRDLPFDVHHFRAHFYGGADERSTLRKRVSRAIRETMAEGVTGAWIRGRHEGPDETERRAGRLREDLDEAIEEFTRAKANAESRLDKDLISRGVLNSSMRVVGRKKIASEYERGRGKAIRDYQRAVEDLGLPTPDPPN